MPRRPTYIFTYLYVDYTYLHVTAVELMSRYYVRLIGLQGIRHQCRSAINTDLNIQHIQSGPIKARILSVTLCHTMRFVTACPLFMCRPKH